MSELKTLQQAIKSAVAAEFSGVVSTVELYGDQFNGSVPTPAVIISLDDAQQGELKGDGRLPLDCQFSALCVLGFTTPNVLLEVRDFAAQMARLVYRNAWRLPDDVEMPTGISLQPGPFNPDKLGYESFVVSWEQTAYVGESIWGGVSVNLSTELNFCINGEPGIEVTVP